MVGSKRHYASPLRTQQAAASRAAILAAARDLFVEQGYGATTIADVAERAGVSKPTVFHAVGNKVELLSRVRDLAMAGDDAQVSVTQRASVAAIVEAPDLTSAAQACARHVVAVVARYAAVHEVIRGASGAHPEVRRLWQVSEEQRMVGAGHLLERLCTHGGPRGSSKRAQQLLWVLMAPDEYVRLVHDCGWSAQAYVTWLTERILAEVVVAG